MKTVITRITALASALVALVAVDAEAARKVERPRIAVLDVQGWKGAAVRDAVARALASTGTVVPKQELTLASRLVDVKSPLGVTKLLATVDAGVAVQVAISGRGASASAALQVFSRDGRRLAKWIGAGPGARGGVAVIARAATAAVREAVDRLAVEAKASLAERPAEPRYETRPTNLVRPTLADAWSEPEKKRGWGEAPKPEAQRIATTAQPADVSASQVAEVRASPVADVRSSPVADVRSSQVADVRATQVADVRATQVAEVRASQVADVRATQVEEVRFVERAPRVVPKDEVEEPEGAATSLAANAGGTPQTLGSTRASLTSGASLASGPSFTSGTSLTSGSASGARRPAGRAVVVPKDELVEGPNDARTVAALAGVTMRQRVAAIALDDGRIAKHDTGVFPEVTLFARTQPFSQAKSALGGVFADVEAAFAVGLSSAIDADERVGTSALRLSFGTGWCWQSGVLSLGGSLGFGLERFALAENDVMGSSSYTFVRPGLVARVAIAGEALTLEGTAGYRAVMSTGELGAPFAQLATASGVDATARLSGTIDADLAITWGLVAGWSRYGLAFADRRGLGAGPAALDGSDTSLTGTAVLGIALR
ncbi:hypothetical protein L6R52_05535 [Myxococcota bacterium]|nr:hypothetical protein [Myxococcota bacterium]